MANTAAHLVDRVLPDVPVRQHVLSLPFELRALAAFKPEVLRSTGRARRSRSNGSGGCRPGASPTA